MKTNLGVSSEDVYATEGSVVRLVCPFTARSGRMTWRGPPQLYPYSINTDKNLTIFLSNNLELSGNFKSGEYSLVIQHFTPSHAGQYQCDTVKNRAARQHRFNIFLQDIIKVNPTESWCRGSSGIVLECTLLILKTAAWKNRWTHSFKGHTIPYLVGSVSGFVSSLRIDACSIEDEGIYTCIWYSDVAEHNSSASVKVLSKPIFVDKSYLFQDKFLIFQIRIYSNPEPNAIQWFHNNQAIDDQRMLNTSLSETMVEISLHDKKVNTTGHLVFLKTRLMSENSPTVYKCQIRNKEGAINVSFDETLINEYDGNMYTVSTMGNSGAGYETIHSSIFGVIKIYMPGTACVILVGLSIVVMIIFRKKNNKRAPQIPTGQTVGAHHPGNNESVISDTTRTDRRRNSVKSYHEYEEVESLSSSQCSHSNANQAYENSEGDVTADKCYINEVGFPILRMTISESIVLKTRDDMPKWLFGNVLRTLYLKGFRGFGSTCKQSETLPQDELVEDKCTSGFEGTCELTETLAKDIEVVEDTSNQVSSLLHVLVSIILMALLVWMLSKIPFKKKGPSHINCYYRLIYISMSKRCRVYDITAYSASDFSLDVEQDEKVTAYSASDLSLDVEQDEKVTAYSASDLSLDVEQDEKVTAYSASDLSLDVEQDEKVDDGSLRRRIDEQEQKEVSKNHDRLKPEILYVPYRNNAAKPFISVIFICMLCVLPGTIAFKAHLGYNQFDNVLGKPGRSPLPNESIIVPDANNFQAHSKPQPAQQNANEEVNKARIGHGLFGQAKVGGKNGDYKKQTEQNRKIREK
ncbi:unnamed protein product [Mytilus edulis]|uniref:Ig-like domain-containing protein n=1 Tax=Mytilus edulis TaxID=6550 RepID=A0A8S3QHV2_MYTED|nr:unnamed protein product [Mytilus edulis]